jgi:hypothetical protein
MQLRSCSLGTTLLAECATADYAPLRSSPAIDTGLVPRPRRPIPAAACP